MRQPARWCGLGCVLVLALSAAAQGQAMDPVGARQWYENAVKKITDKSTADEIFALAKQCYRNGLADEAMAHAIEALRKDPNDSRAKYLLFALAPPAPQKQAKPPEPPWINLLSSKTLLSKTGATVSDEGIRIGTLTSAQPVEVPFEAKFVAKTDSTNIRLSYGANGMVIFNWEMDLGQLRIQDFATGRILGFPGKGRVPIDQWVPISLNVTDTWMEVYADGQLRATAVGNYKGLSAPLGIHSAHGSVVTVKGFRVRRGRSSEPAPARTEAPPMSALIKPGQWVELLPLVDLGRDVVKGQWQMTPQGIRSDTGECSHVAVPVVTSHSYELAFRFTRPDPKTGQVMATFPVGGRSVTLVLGGWGNTKSGLGQVHGRRYLENETTVDPGGLEGGHLYTVDIRVVPEGDQVAIAVALDGKPFIKWKGPQSELGPDPGFTLPHPQCLGLGAGHAYVTFHSMRLRMLSGEARLIRPATAAAGAGETLPSGKWAELLPHVDPAKDTLAGTWTMEGGQLVLSPSGQAKLMLPVAPAGSYELEVRFARVTGNDSLALMLPVGSRLVGLFVSALGGQSHDLGKVRGAGPYDKIAVSPGTLENNRPYTVSARVLVRGDQASVETRLDGASLINWQGPWSDLSPWPSWQLPDSGALGLGAAHGRYVVESMRLKMLSGEARLLRPPG